MKASELRIGNYLNYCDQQTHVLSINNNAILYNVELGYYIESVGFQRRLDDKNITPIELTEEWLIKFGFEQSGLYWYKRNVYIWEWGLTDVTYNMQRLGDENKYNLEIKYIHQLQNLYFALIGKELESK